MKKFLWLIFIGLLLSPVVYGQSSEFLQYDKNLIVRKLDNGLTYYIYPNTNPKGESRLSFVCEGWFRHGEGESTRIGSFPRTHGI